jgi:opacity protein-like surface antigen
MRELIKLGCLLGSILSTCAYAVEPVQGFYLGVLGQVSHSPNIQFGSSFIPFDDDLTISNAKIIFQPVGGGTGISLGYKLNQFRLEGEFFVNYNSYKQLQFNNTFTTVDDLGQPISISGTCTLQSPSVTSPTGACFPGATDNYLAFKGYNLVLDGFFNVFFDFWFNDPTITVVPYIGGGIGWGLTKNTVTFQNNTFYTNGNTLYSFTASETHSNIAAQGILGVYYYMDDFTTLGLDFRYISTFHSNNANATTVNSIFGFPSAGIATINITVNFVLENVFPS